MLRIYLTTAFREIIKNKATSFIHVVGLSIGLAAFILILQYVFYELSYDNFYENADQVYRIRQDRYDKGKLSTTWGAGCAAIGPALKKEFPEVLAYGRLLNAGGTIKINDKNFREDKIFAANTSFLTILPVRLLAGDESTALDEPYTAVISESIARKYFGSVNAIGQTFSFNGEAPFRITGVFKDVPSNTHLKFRILFSWPTYVKWNGPGVETAWNWDGFYTYIQLRKGTKKDAFERKMNDFVTTQIQDIMKQLNQRAVYILQPFRSIHLHSDLMVEAEANGDAGSVYFLMAIAFIILVIAWINYINLATVKAISRSREVAIRKISGASRFQLIRQFLTESFAVSLIASILALVIVIIVLPCFNNLTGKDMSINNIKIWLVFISVIVVGPVVSGLYPALIISSFRAMDIFRGKVSGTPGGVLTRKILVTFQFAASVALVSVTFTIFSQLKYMRSKELGIDIGRTLILKGPEVTDSTYNERLTVFKAELLKYPAIKMISASTSIPGSKVGWNAGGIRRVSEDDSQSNQYRILGIDYDFIDAYKLSIIAGRKFSNELSTDEGSVLFNEEAIKLMGFESPETAIGEVIYFWGRNYRIIGVLRNYHQESLKETYDAIIFRLIPGTRNYFSIKLNNEGLTGLEDNIDQNTFKTIEVLWEKLFPGNPLESFFLSDHYNNQYKDEIQFGTIFASFAILAIIIACLGLFGLSWFLVIQRTKELGIRKVNGATGANILLLLARDIFTLILIAIIVAIPFTYLFSANWMEQFPDRVGFNWGLFAISGMLIIIISSLTISYNTIVMTRSNPAEAIKYT